MIYKICDQCEWEWEKWTTLEDTNWWVLPDGPSLPTLHILSGFMEQLLQRRQILIKVSLALMIFLMTVSLLRKQLKTQRCDFSPLTKVICYSADDPPFLMRKSYCSLCKVLKALAGMLSTQNHSNFSSVLSILPITSFL